MSAVNVTLSTTKSSNEIDTEHSVMEENCGWYFGSKFTKPLALCLSSLTESKMLFDIPVHIASLPIGNLHWGFPNFTSTRVCLFGFEGQVGGVKIEQCQIYG